MEALVVLALMGVAGAAPTFVLPYTGTVVGVPAPLAPVSYARQHHAQDELGQVNYGFAHLGQAKNEIRDALGNVAGVYTYVDADNNPVHVEYTAGANGFQVKSNNLPVAPGAPEVDPLVAPVPVMDTPEVAAAKLEFFEAFNAAAAAASAEESVTEAPVAHVEEPATEASAVDAEEPVTEAPVAEDEEPVTEAAVAEMTVEEEAAEEETSEGEAPTDPMAVGVPETVTDTAEVAAAKAEFQAAYEAAAAAAAAGSLPEVVVPTGAPASVMDTDEVAAAKADFQAAYEAAAAAAEAAPDFDLDGSVSQYSGYLSAVDGALSPLYTNTLLYGAHGIHAPVVAPAPPVAPTHVHYDPILYGPYGSPVFSL